MRQTDLELYRWKWHNEVYLQFKRVQVAKSQMGPASYWKEYGAFVSVLPRQTGKTTMLGVIAKMLNVNKELSKESFIQIVVPTENMAQDFLKKTGLGQNYVYSIERWLWSVDLLAAAPGSHLLVDEFDFIDKGKLSRLLDVEWKSVTMASTLR